MELTPYLDTLRRELSAAAAPGGPDVTRVADLLTGALDAAARLCLLEALSDATAEITRKLETTSVEVRLRGRDADFVVTDLAEPAAAPAEPPADSGDLARITLRLPEPLKAQVERAAAGEGISVNAWLVRAVATAVAGGPPAPPGGHRGARGRRIVGFAQA
jgi:predicted HicB family RNase H-like nuclease